jgi:hypothetical protein
MCAAHLTNAHSYPRWHRAHAHAAVQLELVHRYLREGADPDAPVGKNGMTSMARAAGLKDRQVEIALVSVG